MNPKTTTGLPIAALGLVCLALLWNRAAAFSPMEFPEGAVIGSGSGTVSIETK